MKTEARPVRREGLTSKLLPDNFLVIVDESNESALTLNPTGAAVWEFCDGEHSTDDIIFELSQLFSLPRDELCSVVIAFVDELRSHGLLKFDSTSL